MKHHKSCTNERCHIDCEIAKKGEQQLPEFKHKIGDVIDARQDGSYIYMSHKGVLNLDNYAELEDARREDESFLKE